jgi:hypothetical protein
MHWGDVMDCSGLRDDLLDVLYGEAEAPSRRRVEAHVLACPACRDELAAFGAVRSDLQRWKAPAARPLPFRRAAFRPPVFLAAAAAVVLASIAALGLWGSELRYEEGRFSLRLGRAGTEGVTRALAAVETRHREEMGRLRAELASFPRPGDPAPDLLTQRLAQMLRDSEARQAQKLEAELSGLAERTETRRRYDLARIGAGLAYIDGKNGQQFSRTAEMMGHVLDASQKRGER